MIHNAQEFLDQYGWESECTANVLGALIDGKLGQLNADGARSAGDLAWHISTSPCYIIGQVGYEMPEFEHTTPTDVTAAKIQQTYADVSNRVKKHAETMTSDDLNKVHHVFDRMDWPLHQLLNALIAHEIHHRGQLSIQMRNAGVTVPDIYGPNYEETKEMMKQMQGG